MNTTSSFSLQAVASHENQTLPLHLQRGSSGSSNLPGLWGTLKRQFHYSRISHALHIKFDRAISIKVLFPPLLKDHRFFRIKHQIPFVLVHPNMIKQSGTPFASSINNSGLTSFTPSDDSGKWYSFELRLLMGSSSWNLSVRRLPKVLYC